LAKEITILRLERVKWLLPGNLILSPSVAATCGPWQCQSLVLCFKVQSVDLMACGTTVRNVLD